MLKPLFLRMFRYTPVPVTGVKGPFLIFANHNADLDPVLVNLAFDEQMYFVASEHIFRKGFLSKLLVRYFDPISRLKGGTEASAAMEMLRRLRRGHNICVFAEGDRSFNGLTFPIPPATGKLAKAAGVPVVTFKLEGGYFTTPRWGKKMRRGKMLGYTVNVYEPPALKNMSADEVNRILAEDLFEDAYARQEQERVRFKGKDRAEWLETALYICPRCGGIGTLHSHKNEFFCDCGLRAQFTEYGYLEGDTPYTTIAEWDAWQTHRLKEIAAEQSAAPVFTDENVRLVRVLPGHAEEPADAGRLTMCRDRLTCGETTLLISDISAMAVYGRANVTFTHTDGHFELLAAPPFCGRKYFELFRMIKEGFIL
ncbi:MAG: lysophospholipid acyltransferase family protein [Clostridiaceae bacterium]